jgi:hypothetical protein
MSEQDQELVPFLVITINGNTGKFRAFRRANQWALMQSAAADKTGKYSDAMAANYTVAMTSVLPEDREAFSRFMLENSEDGDYTEQLFEGLGALWAGETYLPLERESTDGLASTSETNSESTPNSSELESDVSLEPVGLDLNTGQPVGSSTPDFH